MSKEQLEKRRGPRIHTALPVLLENAQGVTRDVSATGVYFWMPRVDCLPGEPINFSVEVKRQEARVVLKCQGDVLRKETGAAEIGIAVQITDSAMEQIEPS